MDELKTTMGLAHFNARYARSLDSNRLEEWPDYFEDDCAYVVTTRDNHAAGLSGALIYAKGKGMLLDRVQALRKANVYEGQSYRHVIGLSLFELRADGGTNAETPFVVIRTMRTGEVTVFATGVYIDTLGPDSPVPYRLRKRLVVCDSSRIDTLLAIPL